MENIKNCASWQGSDPLTLRVTGTGAYIKEFLCNIVKHFEDAEYDHKMEIAQEVESEMRSFYNNNGDDLYE